MRNRLNVLPNMERTGVVEIILKIQSWWTYTDIKAYCKAMPIKRMWYW
jgi:hypothetical protein